MTGSTLPNEIQDDTLLRLPVSVLTGFLGSGKTTLLAHLICQPEMARTACIINEFGDVGLDHLIVARGTEDAAAPGTAPDTVVLESGCICCTVRSDLVDTLCSLFMRRLRGEIPEFDRVVIETTGLADPAPILHTLMSNALIAARYRLDGVIATVDAVFGVGQLSQHPESVKQVAVADRLVVTKGDLVRPDATTELIKRLRLLNPAASIIVAAHGVIAHSALFDAGLYNPATKAPEVGRWLNEAAYHDKHVHVHEHGPGCGHDEHNQSRHNLEITSFCLIVDEPMPWLRFLNFVDDLTSAYGERVLRLKGLLNISESPIPLVVHGVQHMFHPVVPLECWPGEDHRSKLVLITRNLERKVVEELLHTHLSAPEPWVPPEE
ncbi:MAG: GTP-binding protein [Rhodospirillaceae bacterium]